MIDYTDEEIREDRDRIISELPARYDQTLDELRKRFDSDIAYSEVMHPGFMLTEIVEHYFMDSPAVVFDEQAFMSAHKANTHLFNLYQRLGALRCYAEERVEKTTPLKLEGKSGAWAEVYFKLGQAPLIRDEVKTHIARLLFVDEHFNMDQSFNMPLDPISPPNLESFHWMMQFLARYSHIETMPNVALQSTGRFMVFYNSPDNFEQFTVIFNTVDYHEVHETVTKPDQFGVGNTSHTIDSIRLPKWLR